MKMLRGLWRLIMVGGSRQDVESKRANEKLEAREPKTEQTNQHH